jgi:hypothetical protein
VSFDSVPYSIPTVGIATLVSTMAIVTLKCVCEKQQILMGQMGLPLECSNCKKVWFVTAVMKVEVKEVLADLNKLASAMS